MSDYEGEVMMPVSVTIGDVSVTLYPRVFRTGSLGWHGQAKVTVHGHRCQVNILATVIGSKAKEDKSVQMDTTPEKAPEAPQIAPRPKKGQIPAQNRPKAV